MRRGVTLIELLVILVVLTIVAVLLVTGLTKSQREERERNASAFLKTLASAEADFRGNDRDANKIQDFWTRDVAGLYGVVPVGDRAMIKLIDVSVAGADFAAAGVSKPGVLGLAEIDRDAYAAPASNGGYWYQRLLNDETGNPYQDNTGGVVDQTDNLSQVSWWNHAKFAFYAFPDTWADGRNAFFINEGNTIFKRKMTGPVKDPSAVPNPSGIRLRYDTDGLFGSQVPEDWPVDTVLKTVAGCDCCR